MQGRWTTTAASQRGGGNLDYHGDGDGEEEADVRASEACEELDVMGEGGGDAQLTSFSHLTLGCMEVHPWRQGTLEEEKIRGPRGG